MDLFVLWILKPVRINFEPPNRVWKAVFVCQTILKCLCRDRDLNFISRFFHRIRNDLSIECDKCFLFSARLLLLTSISIQSEGILRFYCFIYSFQCHMNRNFWINELLLYWILYFISILHFIACFSLILKIDNKLLFDLNLNRFSLILNISSLMQELGSNTVKPVYNELGYNEAYREPNRIDFSTQMHNNWVFR